MSNNKSICNTNYNNYNNYLRNKGCNKDICNLLTNIKSGSINIGPIIPGNCPNNNTIINNNVTINSCTYPNNNPVTGILKVNGGSLNTIADSSNGNVTDFLNSSTNYAIQSANGTRIMGPIVQVSDYKHYNYFGSRYHIFSGGLDISYGQYQSNVLIEGNLILDGSSVDITTTDDINISSLNKNVNFIKNTKVNNSQRTLTNFGETITIIDVSSNNTYTPSQHTINFPLPIFSNIDNSNNIFNNNIIDFSNNQLIVSNSILEIYFSIPCDCINNNNTFSVLLKDTNSSTEIQIDTRNVTINNSLKTIIFGPKTLLFQQGSPDNSYIQKQWNLAFDISGNNIITQNGRLTIKQKSLI